MRAWTQPSYGSPDLLVERELPKPSPGPQQLLLRVQASSVNPVDWKLTSGAYRFLLPLSFPHVPGFDVAGVVDEVGSDMPGFAVGDRVFARLDQATAGAGAEYALVNRTVAVQVPAGLGIDEAAAIPLAGMTALQGLRDQGGLKLERYDGKVLVLGASGGVGHYAVQIAKAAGATVIGVCSGRNAELVRSLGADDVIDYTQEAGLGRCGPYDLVLDCVGQDSFFTLRPHLARGASFVTCAPTNLGTWLGVVLSPLIPGVSCRNVFLKPNAADLKLLADLATAGKLRSVVQTTFPFEQLPEAHRQSQAGRVAGKLVVHGPA